MSYHILDLMASSIPGMGLAIITATIRCRDFSLNPEALEDELDRKCNMIRMALLSSAS